MSAVKLTRLKQSNSDITRSFESATAEVIAYRPWAEQAVLYVLAAFILVLLVVISVAKLDRIVTTTGRVVPVSGTLTVQPLDKSIISRILVSIGDRVKKGQVIATLDPTFAQANLDQLEQKVASLTAERRRLEAEEAGRSFNPNPSQAYDRLQDSISKERATQFRSGVSDFDQRISSTESLVTGLQQSITEYRSRLKILSETAYMYEELEKAGSGTHLQAITAQDQKLELARQLSTAENNLASTQHQLESLREQRKVFVDQWHGDNLNNLLSVENQLDNAENELAKAKKMSDLTTLVAPDDAIVIKTPRLSSGGVVADAEPLFSLVPVNTPLEVDAEIDAKDSGFVKVGDPVRIKFEAYRFFEHGTGEGVVKMVGEDSFTETSSQDSITSTINTGGGEKRSPFFPARITVTKVNLRDVGHDFHLVPGMTLQADIVVGRRTIMWYLLGGAIRSGSEAMHEP